MRGPDGQIVGNDLRAPAVKNFLAYTLRRLGTDYVDVYRPGRVFPDVPVEETVGAIAEMVEAATCVISASPRSVPRRSAGRTPCFPSQTCRSGLADLARDRGGDPPHLPRARDRGDRLRRLSRGLLSGHWSTEREASLTPHDFRASAPRFQGENLARNLELVETLRAVADEKDATVAQLAIAWALSRGEDVVPLVGARTRERLAESLGAVEVDLTQDDLTRIENVVPHDAVAGERYHAEQMAILDSERG